MKRWKMMRRKDYYYKLARRESYRSRAAYKLKDINDRFNLIRSGDYVLDLGAAPGGWSQVAYGFSHPDGVVIGVDVKKISPIKGIIFLKGDIRLESTVEKIKEILYSMDRNYVDVIISDVSPKHTGNYFYDHANSIELAEHVLTFSDKLLRNGGNIVVKVFQGDLYDNFFRKVSKKFNFCKAYKPEASVKSSAEIYIVGKKFFRSL